MLKRLLYISEWWSYMGKPMKKWSACFHAGCGNLVDDLRLDQANSVITADLIDMVDNLVRSDCHIVYFGGEGRCQHWNSVGNCSWEIGFQSNSLTNKRNWVWGSNFNICFGIMKTPLSWNISKLGVAHCLFRYSRSIICWIPQAQKNHYFQFVLWETPKSTQIHQEQNTEAAHRGYCSASW